MVFFHRVPKLSAMNKKCVSMDKVVMGVSVDCLNYRVSVDWVVWGMSEDWIILGV